MGRAKGIANASAREGTEGFAAVFGGRRGGENADRCASCGSRDALSAHTDGCRYCGPCLARVLAEEQLLAVHAEAKQLTAPLLEGLDGATIEAKVAAHLQAADVLRDALARGEQLRNELAGTPAGMQAQARVDALRRELDTVGVVTNLPQGEENKLIRRDLKAAFPDTKFSVRFRSGYGVNVSWTDGPTPAEVETVTSRYASKSFGLDQWGEGETTYHDRYVEGFDGRPVKVSTGSRPKTERRLSPEWNAQLRAELAHVVGDPELLTADPGLRLDVFVEKGIMVPVSGLAEYQRLRLDSTLVRAAEHRRRRSDGTVVMAGGSGYDGMTPWEARNAERAEWGADPEPEPDFAASAQAAPAPAGPATGEEPITTVASLRRRLAEGVQLTCTASSLPHRAQEVGRSRMVTRTQSNMVALGPAEGLASRESFYFPDKNELRATGPDTFDVLNSDGSLYASYSVGPKPAKPASDAPVFTRDGFDSRVDDEGKLRITAPYLHGGRRAGELEVFFAENEYGMTVPRMKLFVGSFGNGGGGKLGWGDLHLGRDSQGRCVVDWNATTFRGDGPSARLRKYAEAALADVDEWLAAQRAAGRSLAELVDAHR